MGSAGKIDERIERVCQRHRFDGERDSGGGKGEVFFIDIMR